MGKNGFGRNLASLDLMSQQSSQQFFVFHEFVVSMHLKATYVSGRIMMGGTAGWLSKNLSTQAMRNCIRALFS